MERLVNSFWGFVASYVCENFNVWNYLKTLYEYNRITEIPTEDTIELLCPNLPDGDITVYKNEDGTIHDVYYKNLHIHVNDTQTNKVVQIFIKRENDAWLINRNENGIFDVSNPYTKNIEVYYWFDIETMHHRKCSDEAYVRGYWNEYVAKTISEFENAVENLTVESQISNAYKNFKIE